MSDLEQAEQDPDASALMAVIWEFDAREWHEQGEGRDRAVRRLADGLMDSVTEAAGCTVIEGPTVFIQAMRHDGDDLVECPADECDVMRVRVEVRVEPRIGSDSLFA